MGAGGFDTNPSASLLLQPRSLTIFCNDAYHNFSHGIDSVRDMLTIAPPSPVHECMHQGLARVLVSSGLLSSCLEGVSLLEIFRQP